jgi:hypothetical protein
MNLKIRLSEALDQRLRMHADNTGATLNSIICLAIDSFLPDGSKPVLVVPVIEPDMEALVVEFAPSKPLEQVVLVPKQQPPNRPKLSAKSTKRERIALAKWQRANTAD